MARETARLGLTLTGAGTAGEPDAAQDATAVRAAVAGDPRAFDLLYRRHARAVHRAVADRERDRDQQLDLVQETFLRAFHRLPELREPERFRAWVLQTARNVAIDHQRRRQRQPLESLGVEHDPESAEATEEFAEVKDLATRLSHGIATLSLRDATALTLHVELGLGPGELAVALGITPNHAKVVLHRARRRLRAAVAWEEQPGGDG